MDIIEKEIETDTAHRVPLHASKCKNLHGHRYKFTAQISGELCDSGSQSGMVLDYSFMKDLMVEHIDNTIDHAIVISTQDRKFFDMAYDQKLTSKKHHIFSDWVNEVEYEVALHGFWSGQTTFGKTYFIYEYPTAENLARHFYRILSPKFNEISDGRATMSALIVNETPTSKATYIGSKS